MFLVEIPLQRFDDQLAQLRAVLTQPGPADMYAQGALDALQWLMHRGPSPADLCRGHLGERECV